MLQRHKTSMINAEQALPGRSQPILLQAKHAVNGEELCASCPTDCAEVSFGLGCFWGAERLFWTQPNVVATAVGYAGGFTPNPTYEEVCSGQTGHTEIVRIWFKNRDGVFDNLLKLFWQAHDPTQGMRQGNDIGTQYRSAIYTTTDTDLTIAETSRQKYQQKLSQAGFGLITTEVKTHTDVFLAEEYHQQYLAKNPNGYCGLSGTGVTYE